MCHEARQVCPSPTSVDEFKSPDKLSQCCSSSVGSPVVPELAWQDLRIGRVMGKGSSNKVKEVSFRKQKYAVKYLRSSTVYHKKNNLAAAAAAAAADLAIEGQLLTLVNHDNIIQLYGQGCLSDGRQFLVLDRLNDTLDRRLRDWTLPSGFFVGEVPSPLERIRSIALPIAKALEYLHSNNIVFRDLNPCNIGFQDNTVKLFDFGSARVVRNGNGLSVDVCSFALLLWELLTLEIPFEGMMAPSDVEAAMRDNRRPVVDKRCGSPRLQELILKAWALSPDSRPTFSTICSVLEEEVASAK